MHDPDLFSAWWCGPAYGPREDFGFFEFSTEFDLESVPESLLVRVSADQRYCLLINGTVVSRGPQRGDERHWHYETIDIAHALEIGKNRIVAEVTNFGWMAPMAQHSVRTAFLLDAAPPMAHLSTGKAWQVRRRSDRDFAMMNESAGEYYIDVGPGEIFRFPELPRGEAWREVHLICRAEIRGQATGGSPWNLVPRTIPLEAIGEGVAPKRGLLRRNGLETEIGLDSFELRAGDELILDFGEITVGYPSIWVSNPIDLTGEITLAYCESLVGSDGEKGNRGETLSKRASGYQDRIRFEGAGQANANPSWIRTFRYISVRPTMPIAHFDLKSYRSGYPYQVQAEFVCEEPSIAPIWDICVRTLRLCAGETYYDCPYYEQLQYVGDTRLQALIGYYLSRDRHLQRNAIEQFHWSILENGLTQSRYPSRQMQVIPPFSLWWIIMVYDAWMHDPEFRPTPYLRSMQSVIEACLALQHFGEPKEPFWNFGDWVPNWKWGIPPMGERSQMHRVLLQFAMWAYMKVSRLDYEVKCPMPSQGEAPTEHAEALWRYWQAISEVETDIWPAAEFSAKCTYFWQYYKHVAHQPDDYVALLEPWQNMLGLGLTTTPETPEPTRSDCHGWSAHPPLGLLQLVAGVTSSSPGWRSCRIAPKPGRLKWFEAKIPHPEGDLIVNYRNGEYDICCPVPYEFMV